MISYYIVTFLFSVYSEQVQSHVKDVVYCMTFYRHVMVTAWYAYVDCDVHVHNLVII